MDYLKKRVQADAEIIDKVMRETGVSCDMAEVLCMRGLTDSDVITDFLNPNLARLTPVTAYSGMQEARDRIKRAVDYGESIVIYGDYDCDGVCATSILYLFLSSLGVEVNYYIPNRKKEGYGINRQAIEEIAEQYAPDLVITVDCGITAYEDILYGMDELGLEFIVTDHHEAPEVIPDCIVIDPKVEYREDTFNELCGAGLALRLCEAVGGDKALMYYMDLACIATIGDVVPLIGDNRIIVSYGLQIVNSRARMNIKLLIESLGIGEDSVLTAQDIAYRIVPRINAIGRLSDPMKAVLMMTDSDYFYTKYLVENATKLNNERQQFTDDLVADAMMKLESYDLVNNRIIVLYSDKWEAGVLGIAAARLVGIYHRPCILLSYDGEIYKGSCRSIEGVNLYECLDAVKSFIHSFGGHRMACGVSVNPDSMESFIMAVNEYARRFDSDIFLPYVTYDLERRVEDITVEAVDELSRLEPFGMSNPIVSYRVDGVSDKFERISATKHIKSRVSDDIDMVYFDGLPRLAEINATDNIDIVADLSPKIFNNRRYVQGLVKEIAFDQTNYAADEEYLSVKYIYNARYSDSTIFDVRYVSEDDVSALVTNELYGTCFIASNIDTFRRFSVILDGKVRRTDVRNISELNPYNRLVLDMDINQNLVYYQRIVLLDRPVSIGVVDYYRLNKNAEVYVVDKGLDTAAIDIVRKAFPDIDKMRNIFVRVRGLLDKSKVSSLGELYELYRTMYGDCTVPFYIAMYVFFELKILRSRGGVITVDRSVRTSLEDSVIYTRIKEVVYGK